MKIKAKQLLIASAFSCFFVGSAHAKCVPYDTVLVPEKFECSGSGAKGPTAFDDFSVNPCKRTPAHYIQVPKECPPEEPGLWVQWYEGGAAGHKAACDSVGLVPSHLNGDICVSGDERPNKGGGWDKLTF